MANLSQTPANVTVKSRAGTPTEQAGEAITQGMPIYQDGGKWYQTQATETKHNAERIALTPASGDGEYFVAVLPGNDVDVGATLTVGETYVVSATAGAIAPIGDLTTGDYVRILGIAKTANSLRFEPQSAGVAKA